MQHEVEINGRIRQVAVHRADEGFAVAIDGRAWQVLAAQVDRHTLSLLIADGVRLKPDTTTDTTAGGRESFSTRGIRKTTPDPRTVLSYEVTLVPDPASAQLVVSVAGPAVSLGRRTTQVLVTLNGRRSRRTGSEGAQIGSGPQRIVSPMAGKIVRVLVKSGEAVRARQPLVVVEAMKMENELRALRDGTVTEIHAREGTSVDAGILLVVVG
jgi:biotin carboxyl carrier protein